MGDRWKSLYFTRKRRRQRENDPQKPAVVIVDSAKKACIKKCTTENRTDMADAHGGCTIASVPVQFNSKDEGTSCNVTTSKKSDVLKACLRAFEEKKDELCRQQHLLEDEIARCEMNIQTILSGEENWMQKVETIIEALNSSFSSGVQGPSSTHPFQVQQ
ncbi:uncharacterized protein A4U43_C02F3080 [Asparagus officinalis]|uniref:Uncharacterized protein n=1 Tax=Asparagus officinalis TaxID=4686 RepID=A0A5P1FFG2_ASPOF|nr:uncharacterized protein LOC109830008 [Asparagus officinalis]ONK77098.1 uncharacterized protein A4U43_C02F3080 [Asparagus officinalis]